MNRSTNEPSDRTFTFLQTKRLGFRHWRSDDLDIAMKIWGVHDVTKHFDARGPWTKKQVQQRLTEERSNQRDYGIQYWPIFTLDTQENVGCCGLRPYDLSAQTLELGAHIRPKFWRCGYATEAARAVIVYAFFTLKVAALFAGHNPRNQASRSLLKKLGFRYTHDEYYPPTGLEHPSYLLEKA